MTREAFFEPGTAFSEWTRGNPELDREVQGLSITDRDYFFHKFRTIIDGVATNDVQMTLHLEVKCYGAYPGASQRENLWIAHQLWNTACGGKRLRTTEVTRLHGQKLNLWDFGYSILILPGELPAAGMKYCRFGETSELIERRLESEDELVDILNFRVRPDTPSIPAKWCKKDGCKEKTP